MNNVHLMTQEKYRVEKTGLKTKPGARAPNWLSRCAQAARPCRPAPACRAPHARPALAPRLSRSYESVCAASALPHARASARAPSALHARLLRPRAVSLLQWLYCNTALPNLSHNTIHCITIQFSPASLLQYNSAIQFSFLAAIQSSPLLTNVAIQHLSGNIILAFQA